MLQQSSSSSSSSSSITSSSSLPLSFPYPLSTIAIAVIATALLFCSFRRPRILMDSHDYPGKKKKHHNHSNGLGGEDY
uniref:Transmembrane protein n=1 Tax=Vespula pensylvanica TaxID=30213 RepID=A0A834MZK5_VESPE|nr:hypothetical protein H0235_018008 [Vespula pensylvanica]